MTVMVSGSVFNLFPYTDLTAVTPQTEIGRAYDAIRAAHPDVDQALQHINSPGERLVHLSDAVAGEAQQLLEKVARGDIGISTKRFGMSGLSASVDRHVVHHLGFLAGRGPSSDVAKIGATIAMAVHEVDQKVGQYRELPLLSPLSALELAAGSAWAIFAFGLGARRST